jgi:hypothetical protein
MSSDRTANFFVGMLRSYQLPNQGESPKEKMRKEKIKRILLKRALVA